MEAQPTVIVVVDDDESMGLALKRLLTAAGFEARVFGSAEALGASGSAHGAHCLVLDMHLPGASGPEFYAGLPAPRPPAVFITAHDGRAARGAVQRVGGHGFLAKPFDGSAFLEMVTKATDSRRGPGRPGQSNTN